MTMPGAWSHGALAEKASWEPGENVGYLWGTQGQLPLQQGLQHRTEGAGGAQGRCHHL